MNNEFMNKVQFDSYLNMAYFLISLIEKCNTEIDILTFTEVQYLQRGIYIKELKKINTKLQKLIKHIKSSYYLNYLIELHTNNTIIELKNNGLL